MLGRGKNDKRGTVNPTEEENNKTAIDQEKKEQRRERKDNRWQNQKCLRATKNFAV